jgi:hypothetical protein
MLLTDEEKGNLTKKQSIIQAAARLWRIKPRNPEIRTEIHPSTTCK